MTVFEIVFLQKLHRNYSERVDGKLCGFNEWRSCNMAIAALKTFRWFSSVYGDQNDQS